MPLDSYLVFCATSILLAFTPGPDIIYVLTRGVAQGRSAALAAAAGFSLGNIAHTFFAVIGLSAIIVSSAMLFTIVKLAGAAYLIYIGIKIFRSASPHMVQQNGQHMTSKAIFRQSIVANILNPKVAVFFLAYFPQFISPANGAPEKQIILLGLTFMIIGFICFSSVALASGYINTQLTKKPAAGRLLNRTAGSVLVLLGIKLALSEAS